MPTQKRRNNPSSKSEGTNIETPANKAAKRLHPTGLIPLRLLISLLVIIGIIYLGRIATSTPDSNVGSNAFEVASLPGKGMGLVATRHIKQGELIIKEKPLFVVPKSINSSPTDLISQLLSGTSPSDRQGFFNLSYANFPKHLTPTEHPGEVALAIFQTNAVSIGDSIGIFPHMARLNHGCSSAFNVVYSWRATAKVLVVHALKSIEKGEELLTAYMNTRRPRSERRAILTEQYGFFCSCDVCSLSDAQSLASDGRLVEISNSYDRFASWGDRKIDGVSAINFARGIWTLGDEEGYWSERGRLAADAAFVAASHSDFAATLEWAQLAAEWYAYELGEDSDQVEEMKGVIFNPRSHSAWGSRESLGVGGPSVYRMT